MNIWLQRYLALVVFLIPWQARWIFEPRELGTGGISEYLTLSLYALDVLMVIGILWSYFSLRPKFKVSELQNRKLLLVMAIVAVISINVLMADNIALATWKLAHLTLMVIFGATIIRSGSFSYLRLALVLAALTQSGLAIYQFLYQNISANTLLGIASQLPSNAGVSVIETINGRWLRAYGSFPHPNILGGFLALASLIIIDWYFNVYEKFQNWWNKNGVGNNNLLREPIIWRTTAILSFILISFVLVLSGLFVSFSRGAVLTTLLAGIVYWVQKFWQNNIRGSVLGIKLLIITAGTIIAWQFLFPGIWSSRIEGHNRLEVQSNTERLVGYEQASNIFRKNPIIGTGFQHYVKTLATVNPDRPAYTYQPVHNTFFLILVEIGFLGLIMLVITFLYYQKKIINIITLTPTTNAMAILFVALIFADHYLWSLHAGMVLWLIGAILLLKNKES